MNGEEISMSKFKVGDWVRWDRGKVSEVLAVSEECLIENHSALSNGCNVHNDELELWEPQPGEWCWFWDKETPFPERPFIDKHCGNYDSGEYVSESKFAGNSYWQNCEPFMGELPSWIKGK